MSNRKRLVTALSLVLASGCSQPTETEPQVSEDAITNARTTTSYPAVGFLVVGDYAYTCTATLVAPQVLLTAAHCIYYRDAVIRVWLRGEWYSADRWNWHPGYDPNAVGLAPPNDIDVGVVHLRSPVYGITPLRLADWVPATGDVFAAVGFGETSAGGGGSGYRRATRATVGSVAGSWFFGSGTASPCHGDSGGPAIAPDGSILGVFARMHNSCSGGSDSFVYVPVAPLLGWFAQF